MAKQEYPMPLLTAKEMQEDSYISFCVVTDPDGLLLSQDMLPG